MERNSPNVGSLGQLASCGAAHIASYLDRGSTFAWCYDHPGNPEQLMPADVTATALLDYPIPPAYMRAMFCPDTGDNPYAALRVALQAVLDNQEVQHTAFEDVPREAVTDEHLHGPWGYVRQALRAVDTCEGLTAVAVSKILHRKRPWCPSTTSRCGASTGCGPTPPGTSGLLFMTTSTPTVISLRGGATAIRPSTAPASQSFAPRISRSGTTEHKAAPQPWQAANAHPARTGAMPTGFVAGLRAIWQARAPYDRGDRARGGARRVQIRSRAEVVAHARDPSRTRKPASRSNAIASYSLMEVARGTQRCCLL